MLGWRTNAPRAESDIPQGFFFLHSSLAFLLGIFVPFLFPSQNVSFFLFPHLPFFPLFPAPSAFWEQKITENIWEELKNLFLI